MPLLKRHLEIERILAAKGIDRPMWGRKTAIVVRGEHSDEKENTRESLEWVLATERPTVVFDWDRWEFIEEILLADGMEVPENNQVVLLDSHRRESVHDILGHVADFGEIKIGGYAGRSGKIYLADDTVGQCVRMKIEDNHLTDGSVGYLPLKSVWVPEEEEVAIGGRTFTGPVRVTYRWFLREFSLTPIGADVLAKVRHLCKSSIV